jgi:signal transduction histidine kinase
MAASRFSFLHTLSFRAWLILVLLCGVTLSVVGLSQVFLLDSMTESNRLDLVRESGNQIAAQAAADPAMVEAIAYEHGWRIMVLDEALEPVQRYDGFDLTCKGAPAGELSPLSAFTLGNISQLAARLAAEPNLAWTDIMTRNESDDVDVVVYFARLQAPWDGSYLYISSVLLTSEPMHETLITQFFIAAGLVMIVAVVVARLLSRVMTRPIVDLTKGAQRLAHGDFSTEFDGKGFTETEQLATTLTYAANELRTVDSDRKELLANVSHDLKTPLTIIKIYAETIRDVAGDDPVKRAAHCETIIEEANRLTDMVNEIVEISRLESGAATIVMARVDLAECLQETMMSFRILQESEGYTFDVQAAPAAPIVGNEHFLRRALYNLIGNAVNYTGPDRYVGVSLTESEGRIRFEVADHGPGIPTDKISTIWDRYYKSRSSHKRAVIGSGIGLSIVRHILKLHHATFGVTSAPGIGSRFWFEVPVAPPEAEPAPAEE